MFSMKNKKRGVIFYELHPVNFMPALIISFFCRVVYWKKKYLPLFLMKRFEQIIKMGSFTLGEWVEVNALIYFKLKEVFEKERFKHRLYLNYRKLSIDLTLSAMQRSVMNYQSVCQFYKLIDYWEGRQESNFKVSIVNFNLNTSLDQLGIGVERNDRHFIFKINSSLDRGLDVIENCALLFQLLARIIKNLLGLNKCKNHNNSEKVKYFWYCFTLNEMATGANCMDLATLVRRKLISNEESLYVLPKEPDEYQKSWFHKNSINWVVREKILDLLPKAKQIGIFWWLLNVIFFPWKWKGVDALRYTIQKYFLIKDIPLFEYFMYINAKILLTGMSNGMLESPIVSIARGLGRKTVWWSYAGIAPKHILNKLPFKYSYELVEESITLSEEKLVWSDLDKLMLNKRSLNPAQEDQAKFIKMGPIMSGDSNWLQKNPYQARKDYGFQGNPNCKIWITIFDLPTHEDYKLTEYGNHWVLTGISKEMQNGFFKDITRLLEQFPEVGVIYKPKRPFAGMDRYNLANVFFYGKELLEFIGEKNKFAISRRLITLSYNIDPYIPIALGDLAITMPYTTALFAFLAAGKTGIYYDATSIINHTYPPEIDRITVGGYRDLSETIQKWLSGSVDTPKPIKDFLRFEGDPGRNFSDYLKQLS